MFSITNRHKHSIYKPGTDQIAFTLADSVVEMDGQNSKPAFFELYTVLWVQSGEGEVKVDFGKYVLKPGTLMFLMPYQPFVIEKGKRFEVTVLEFSSEFFCIEKHRHEVSCNGVLFNGIYGPPFLYADTALETELQQVVNAMTTELDKGGLAQEEMLFSYLKIFLIRASRAKMLTINGEVKDETRSDNSVLINFQDLVEGNFTKEHGVAYYADKLFIQPNTLSKLTKRFYGKSPGQVIKERVMVEAKRMLYLTQSSVKEISYGLGFDDPAYFNRFFKKWAQITPEEYRQRQR